MPRNDKVPKPFKENFNTLKVFLMWTSPLPMAVVCLVTTHLYQTYLICFKFQVTFVGPSVCFNSALKFKQFYWPEKSSVIWANLMTFLNYLFLNSALNSALQMARLGFSPTTFSRGVIWAHNSRVAPDWDLWRTHYRLSYSATANQSNDLIFSWNSS